MTEPHIPVDTPDETVEAPVLLEVPAEGVPHVVESERGLDEAAAAIAAGEGPVAIDAERASGYRYGQRAYLVQVRREGAGTWLVDPVAVPDLAPLAEAIGQLPQQVQEATLEALLTVIARLVDDGTITVARTCITCRFHRHDGVSHHCNLLGIDLPTRELRVNCPEHQPA